MTNSNDNPFDGLHRFETHDRTKYVGSSDVAAILGLSRWRGPLDVWLRLVEGHVDDKRDNPAMERGRRFERAVVEWTADRLGADCIADGIPVDEPAIMGPEPWMGFHPDAAFRVDSRWLLGEIKTTRASDAWHGGVPDDYWLQVLWGLACVPSCDSAVLGSFFMLDDDLKLYPIERVAEDVDWLLNEVGAWYWRHVVRREPVPIEGSKSAANFLAKRHAQRSQTVRNATPNERALVDALVENKRRLKAIQQVASEEIARLDNALRVAIGDDRGLRTDDGRLLLIDISGSKGIDAKALRETHPDIALRFETKGADRREVRWYPAKTKGEK